MLRKKSFFILLLIAFSASPFACQSKQAVKELPEIKEHERQVKLDGQANFRDLGGYSTTDGRSVKWGFIYRAGQLNELSDADLSKLKELDIRTVIDLRGTSEAESRGKDRLPDGVRNMSYPIDVMSLPKEEEESIATDSSFGRPDFMLQATRLIMIHRTDVYAALIRELAAPENRPLVFHCTAGKDRAGIGAAIVLTLLGVPWETVREDYLLSNFYRRDENEREIGKMREDIAKKQGIPAEQVDMTAYESMYLVKPEYIDAARDAVIRKYGSMESYLHQGLGISEEMISQLRNELLE
jgi:protein-tyrosine phosphatase